MYVKNNGYVSGAVLLLPHIRKMREVLEFEKLQCRILKDDERTREFKIKTAGLKDKLYDFRYNHPEVEKMTAAGKKEIDNASK